MDQPVPPMLLLFLQLVQVFELTLISHRFDGHQQQVSSYW